MTRNMGQADRIIRPIIAVVLAALIATGTVNGVWAIVAGVVAVAFLVTSVMGFCPGYWPFGVSTRGRVKPHAQ